MGTIAQYPAPIRQVDGSDLLAGFQDGSQKAIPVSSIGQVIGAQLLPLFQTADDAADAYRSIQESILRTASNLITTQGLIAGLLINSQGN